MKGKKFKQRIRRVQRRMEDEFGDKIHYQWLLRLNNSLVTEDCTNPTEDELFLKAREDYRE